MRYCKEGLLVLKAWGFEYKTNIVWHKIRKDGGPDGRGVGFYFRNTTELLLFGVRGKNARTLAPGRSQVNILKSQKREHSRKPDEQYQLIEGCSPGPFLEMFGRGTSKNWITWGNQAENYFPTWKTYVNHSQSGNIESLSAGIVGTENLAQLFALYQRFSQNKRRAIHLFLQHIQLRQYFIKLPTEAEVYTLLAMSNNQLHKRLSYTLNLSLKTIENWIATIRQNLSIPLDILLQMVREKHQWPIPEMQDN